jgi:hypothetical protein
VADVQSKEKKHPARLRRSIASQALQACILRLAAMQPIPPHYSVMGNGP